MNLRKQGEILNKISIITSIVVTGISHYMSEDPQTVKLELLPELCRLLSLFS